MEENTQSATDVRLQLLRKQFQQKEAEKNRGYGFAVSITLKEEPNRPILVLERGQGIENFDTAIEDAKAFNPHSIIVNSFRTKTEKPKKANEYRLVMVEESTEPKKPIAEQIEEAVSKQIADMQETLKGVDEIGKQEAVQKFEHLGKILTLNSEKEITAMKHANEVSELNRQLTERLEALHSQRETIGKLEKDLKTVEKDYETFRSEKLSGMSDALVEAGGQLASNLAQQYLPKLLGGNAATVSGVTGDDGQKATMVDENNPVEVLLGQMRMIISEYDEQTFKNFYSLMELIAADEGIIQVALELIAPNREEAR